MTEAESYVHLAHPAGEGAPLLFLFHGTGGDEHQFGEIAQQILPSARLVAPRGDVSEFGAARFFRRTGEGVYDMEDLSRATRKMARFVAAHREIARPSATLALGYSNGANILASVFFQQPELFDAVVLMHPLIPFKPQIGAAVAGRRVLITAGRRDPICPPQLTETLADDLQLAGAAVTLDWHEGGHELRPRELQAAAALLQQYKTAGGGNGTI